VTPNKKLLAAFLLFLVWGLLVWTGRTGVTDYVTAIRDALIALGVFTATITPPSNPGS